MSSSVFYLEHQLNVEVIPQFYSSGEANDIFNELSQLPFYTPIFRNQRGEYSPNRKVYAFGDLTYSFSGASIAGVPWTPLMLRIKADVEKTFQHSYNFALLNVYTDGDSSIAYHKHDESYMDSNIPVLTLSFGAERTVVFQRENVTPTKIPLPSGSLYAMHPPTNQLFKHGIPAEPQVKNARISISFRSLMTVDTPPAKRQCLDLQIPDEDWLTRHVRSCSPTYEMICSWKLPHNTTVSVMLNRNNVRVHIREYNESKNGHFSPTSRGVVMLPTTWREFSNKLSDFSLLYQDTSFVANNQLLVFCDREQCHLQQIFKMEKEYILKPACIQLNDIQLESLKEQCDQISNALLETIFHRSLPNMILDRKGQCQQSIHCNIEEAKLGLLKSVKKEVSSCIQRINKCLGCQLAHGSQRRHVCIMDSTEQKFLSVGNHIFLCMNLKNIVDELCEKQCICPLTRDILTDISIKDYINFAKY